MAGDPRSGQSRLVVFRLTPSDLAYDDQSAGGWTVAPGRYTALVGTSSTDLSHGRPLHGERRGRARRRVR